jgi:RNA polymerase sigma-70 factor (ECF subfamily)
VNQIRQHRTSTVPLDDEALEIPVRATQTDGLEMRDLAAAVARLPVEYREVILLVGLEQMGYEEAAQVLGVPLGTVMSRLSRGRERLRALMAGATTPMLRRVK